MIPIRDDNPATLTPVVTFSLIALCGGTFVWQLALGEGGNVNAVHAFGLIPAVLTGAAELPPQLDIIAPPLSVLTSMFLHGGFLHLAGNVLYLWVFADNVEDAMGHWRFVLFYALCGTAAALAQTLHAPSSAIPMVGASGAISGVLGAYLVLYPRARVLVLLPLGFYLHATKMPAGLLLVLWFAIQIMSSLMADPNTPGVAWLAHIGGFAAGVALIPFIKHRNVPLLA